MPSTFTPSAFAILPSMLSLPHYLLLSVALLSIGVIGALVRRNLLIRLFSIELILTAAAINLASFARLFGDSAGQAFALIVNGIVVAETLVLLAVVTAAFRRWQVLTMGSPQDATLDEPDAAIGQSSQIQS
jgi:NADH-quinone oxidoreductase subunit K